MEYKDYYQILGVKKTADAKDIKRAYRNLALKYHPDKNPGNRRSEEKFKEINEAYEVIGDPDNRRKYDQLGRNYHRYQQMGGRPGDFDFSQWFGRGGPGQTQESTFNINDLFGEGRQSSFSDFFQSIFGESSHFGQQTTPGNNRGQPLEEPVQITLEEAFQGTTRAYSRNGSRFTAKIPAGAKDGAKIRLRGKGQPGPGGRGDLYLVIQIKPHPLFTVEDNNLKTTIEVELLTAVLGGKVTVPTLSGEVQLSIPAGTQGGQTFRLRKKGMPDMYQNSEIGDLFAKVRIRVPTNLSEEELALYKQLSDAAGVK